MRKWLGYVGLSIILVGIIIFISSDLLFSKNETPILPKNSVTFSILNCPETIYSGENFFGENFIYLLEITSNTSEKFINPRAEASANVEIVNSENKSFALNLEFYVKSGIQFSFNFFADNYIKNSTKFTSVPFSESLEVEFSKLVDEDNLEYTPNVAGKNNNGGIMEIFYVDDCFVNEAIKNRHPATLDFNLRINNFNAGELSLPANYYFKAISSKPDVLEVVSFNKCCGTGIIRSKTVGTATITFMLVKEASSEEFCRKKASFNNYNFNAFYTCNFNTPHECNFINFENSNEIKISISQKFEISYVPVDSVLERSEPYIINLAEGDYVDLNLDFSPAYARPKFSFNDNSILQIQENKLQCLVGANEIIDKLETNFYIVLKDGTHYFNVEIINEVFEEPDLDCEYFFEISLHEKCEDSGIVLYKYSLTVKLLEPIMIRLKICVKNKNHVEQDPNYSDPVLSGDEIFEGLNFSSDNLLIIINNTGNATITISHMELSVSVSIEIIVS